VSLVAIGVLIVPMLLTSLHGSKTGWLPSPHLHDVYNLFLTICANSKVYLLILFGFCALGLLVSMLVYLPQGKELLAQFALYNSGDDKRNTTLQQYLPVAFMLLCWLVIPIVISYVVSQGSTRLFSTRYLVIILPPLFLLVGLGVASLRWRFVQLARTLILFFTAFYYVPLYYKSAQVEDWNSTVYWLQEHYQAGDGLVCYDSDVEQGCQVSVEYYLHAYPSTAHFTGDSPGEFSWTNFGPADSHSGPEAAVDLGALAAYASQHPNIFYITGRIPNDAAAARATAAQHWLDANYFLRGRIVTPTVTISLYAP
jgi:mannosyltransferase